MRRTVATWAGLLGSTVLLTGALAGCTGDEPDDPASPTSGAGAETSASASPTAEPSPDVTKPERPAAMDEHDADGAAAAAVYFMEQWEYIMKSGDTAEWEAMSGQGCSTCKDGLKQARTIADNRYVYRGGEMSAHVETRYERDPVTGIWPVDVQSTTAPITIEDEDGKEVESFEGGASGSRVEVGLSKEDDWVIVEIADIPEDS